MQQTPSATPTFQHGIFKPLLCSTQSCTLQQVLFNIYFVMHFVEPGEQQIWEKNFLIIGKEMFYVQIFAVKQCL